MRDRPLGHIVPYTTRSEKNHDTGQVAFTVSCKFCVFKRESASGFIKPKGEVEKHARDEGHYDAVSGLWYSKRDVKRVQEERRERRRILGSYEDTQNLNQAGL